MRPALPAVRQAIAELEFRDPRFPVIPNVNGKPTEDGTALRDLLTRQMISPVRWEMSMRSMHESLGVDDFVEAGPGEVLSKLTRRCVKRARGTAVGSPEAAVEVASSLRRGERA
jgi:[acyl-carrier-protein] S-malonyltransferase